MKKIKFDYQNVLNFVREEEISMMEKSVMVAEEMLKNKSGAGSDYLGWVDLPVTFDKNELEDIKKTATEIQKKSDVLVVIGIGGSYLGARAAIDFMSSSFYNEAQDVAAKKHPKIYYVGNNISGSYINDLLNVIKGKDICVNVISKSGTTTEPAIAFRIFKDLLEKKYGKDGAKERIIATTDKARGALKTLADKEGYKCFVIPDDVGGRFSVLTPVGLLPIAVAGIDIDELMAGAKEAHKNYSASFAENDAYKYAAIRNILSRKGKNIEMLINYEPRLHYFGEWWKQLFGESEGKDQKGIFPAAADFSTDLHSMGQFIQDGSRNLFETGIIVEEPESDIVIDKEETDLDGLNYLAGKGVNFVNSMANIGTMLAHVDGGTPNMKLVAPDMSAASLGQMIYFFEKAVGISGYMLGVNPFNQPGVEEYKKNMFALLGKPGYEEATKSINERLNGKK